MKRPHNIIIHRKSWCKRYKRSQYTTTQECVRTRWYHPHYISELHEFQHSATSIVKAQQLIVSQWHLSEGAMNSGELLELPSLPSHLYNWLLTRHVPVSPTKLQAASPERNQVLQGLCRIGTRQVLGWSDYSKSQYVWDDGRKQEEKKESDAFFYIEHPKHRASIPNTRKKTAQSSHHVNSLCIIRCLILLERSGFIKSIEGIFSSIDRTVMSWQFKGKAMSWPMGLPVPFIIFPCFIIFDHLKAGCQAVKCSL